MIKKFNDHRGDFVLFDASNCDQVNVVTNKRKYTFRGLHYQTNPPQTKMVKIIQGKVLDILYDLKTHKLEFYLLDKYSEPLYVADNYAHGYLTLEDNTIFTYAVKGEYNPESELNIIWSDIMALHDVIMSHVGTLGTLTISDKDSKGK